MELLNNIILTVKQIINDKRKWKRISRKKQSKWNTVVERKR